MTSGNDAVLVGVMVMRDGALIHSFYGRFMKSTAAQQQLMHRTRRMRR